MAYSVHQGQSTGDQADHTPTKSHSSAAQCEEVFVVFVSSLLNVKL